MGQRSKRMLTQPRNTEEVMGKAEASRILEKYPRYRDWHKRLMDRPAVQRIMQNNDISTQ